MAAQPKNMKANDAWNIGIIGFGYMGRMHAMSYASLKFYYENVPEVNLYAVAETQHRLASLPITVEKRYEDWRELVADPDIDIVDICAPNDLHADILCAAVRADKHIYCEKPLAIDLPSARRVIETIRETGYEKTIRMGFEYRFVPAVLRAKQMLEADEIGTLVQFNFRYYGSEFIDPDRPISWQSTRSQAGGGVLYAMGTHSLDLIRYLVGEVDNVFALQSTHFKRRPLMGTSEMADVEIEDIINVQLDCSGVPGTLLLSQVAAGSAIDFSFEIYGERGALRFDQSQPNHLQYFSNEDEKDPIGGYSGWKLIETAQKYGGAIFPPPRVNVSFTRYHIASIYDFVTAVNGGRTSHPNVTDGLRVQELTDAIYRSAQEGRIAPVNREE